MVQQFLGEIKLVGFNFAPQQWALCAGQTMPVNQNGALFALLGAMYGGDGATTFCLPDLQGRAIGGVGPNLYTTQGMKLGTETVSIGSTQYPAHNHMVNANGTAPTTALPTGHFLSTTGPSSAPPNLYTTAQGATLQPLNNQGNTPVIGVAPGGSQPHENMMPFLTMTYIIALYGVFPSRG
jgi:microcystin-dependent protein